MRELEQTIAEGFKTGASRIAASARLNAPVLKSRSRVRSPGELRDAISAESVQVTEGHVHVAVGIDESKAFYGRFQETGFHIRNRKVPGRHFMGRAFDQNKQAIATDVARRVKSVIDKANGSP